MHGVPASQEWWDPEHRDFGKGSSRAKSISEKWMRYRIDCFGWIYLS